MTEYAALLPYVSIAFIATFTTLGVGIGSGKASLAAVEAINIQPRAKNEINRTTIIGLALIETAAILSLIICFMFFRKPVNPENMVYSGIVYVGIACAVGITGFVVGLVSSYPVQKACLSIARQPFFSQKILNIMLITQSIIQTASIFGFLIAMLINLQMDSITTLTHSIILCASGIAIGFGSIGPAVGLGRFARTACRSISVNRKAYDRILPFIFMSVAIIETPLIFAFLISLILTGSGKSYQDENMLGAFRALCSALCIGIGTLSPGLSSSKTAASACKQISRNPDNYSALSQTSMFGQGLIDAAAVYALLVSLLILFL